MWREGIVHGLLVAVLVILAQSFAPTTLHDEKITSAHQAVVPHKLQQLIYRNALLPDPVFDDANLCRSKSGRLCDPDGVHETFDVAKLEHELEVLVKNNICHGVKFSVAAMLRKVGPFLGFLCSLP